MPDSEIMVLNLKNNMIDADMSRISIGDDRAEGDLSDYLVWPLGCLRKNPETRRDLYRVNRTVPHPKPSRSDIIWTSQLFRFQKVASHPQCSLGSTW